MDGARSALEGVAGKEEVLLDYLQGSVSSLPEPRDLLWAGWLPQGGQDRGVPLGSSLITTLQYPLTEHLLCTRGLETHYYSSSHPL